MKPFSATRLATLAFLLGGALQAQTPALPEPGLFIYGPIVNKVSQQPVPASAVQWQVSGGGEGVTLNATLININGQVFHLTRVPFETRVVGTQNFARTPGTLELKVGAVTYSRAATVDGAPAILVSSSLNQLASFPFSVADRGVAERVVLGVDKVVDPGKDTDGDGVSDVDEAIAGTNPNDPKSFFKITTDLTVNAQGGLVIRWDSVAGRRYGVLRSTELTKGFTPLASNLAATPPANTFSDTAPPAAAQVFYRITVAN